MKNSIQTANLFQVSSKEETEWGIIFTLNNGHQVSVARMDDGDWDYKGSMSTYDTACDAIDDYIETEYIHHIGG